LSDCPSIAHQAKYNLTYWCGLFIVEHGKEIIESRICFLRGRKEEASMRRGHILEGRLT
jgi:hypothetical protein